jgi:hypothetical protein
MLLFGPSVGRKLYGISSTRYSPGFWQTSLVIVIILLDQSVQDSAAGKDVCTASAVRMGALCGDYDLRVSDVADFRATPACAMTLSTAVPRPNAYIEFPADGVPKSGMGLTFAHV